MTNIYPTAKQLNDIFIKSFGLKNTGEDMSGAIELVDPNTDFSKKTKAELIQLIKHQTEFFTHISDEVLNLKKYAKTLAMERDQARKDYEGKCKDFQKSQEYLKQARRIILTVMEIWDEYE